VVLRAFQSSVSLDSSGSKAKPCLCVRAHTIQLARLRPGSLRTGYTRPWARPLKNRLCERTSKTPLHRLRTDVPWASNPIKMHDALIAQIPFSRSSYFFLGAAIPMINQTIDHRLVFLFVKIAKLTGPCRTL